MRPVRDNLDLAELQRAGRGFILNDRADGARLHRAYCDSVGAMHPDAHAKIFFDELNEAVAWLKQNRPDWKPCGLCGTSRTFGN